MDISSRLTEIVGGDRVSDNQEELFFYSRDPGAQPPGRVDYVVMPRTVEEVRQVVLLANREKIPVTPWGGGFTLSALVVPDRGGIVLDMKQMDRILEIDEINRYALIEPGVSQGALRSYLRKHHPRLQHSTPEAPPTVTVVGNALIQGHGHISPRYGINSDMVNGMEVVLPTGKVCQIGSGSMGASWFTRGPLPDLPGLFIGWFGTTGIVTKLSLKLFPKPAFREVLAFYTDDVDLIPEGIFEVTQLDLLEDFFLISQEKPDWMNHVFFIIIISGHFEEEIGFKKKAFKDLFREFKGGGKFIFVEDLHPALEKRFLDVPPLAALAADFRKGGGFEYTGAILPIDRVPEAWRKGIEISHKYGMICSYVHQVLLGHSVMFGFNYSFNRADEEDVEKTRKALEESNRVTLDLGGMIWKGEVEAQRMTLERMDPNTVELIRGVKELLDPNGIMNPGKWEMP
ncbi:MAG: FAD-binding oxidoreductase [Deltaproteobacteria bacterium]|nr:FAD-binding oxidoreductase [Deltaproteobacteria bacterium]MBW2353360.1 FAD-binding oxidoreductase [Deltaproteobacteria bacterium]HDZ89823.1 FAD-binding oxidoreductase [Deltaproteobacteria bacterium]